MKKKNELDELFLNFTQYDDVTKSDFPNMNPKIYDYLAKNFFYQLGIRRLTEDNINHIFDALINTRDAFFSVGIYEVVDKMNFCIDQIVDFLPTVEGLPYNKYFYRKTNYRKPFIKNIKPFLSRQKSLFYNEKDNDEKYEIMNNNSLDKLAPKTYKPQYEYLSMEDFVAENQADKIASEDENLQNVAEQVSYDFCEEKDNTQDESKENISVDVFDVAQQMVIDQEVFEEIFGASRLAENVQHKPPIIVAEPLDKYVTIPTFDKENKNDFEISKLDSSELKKHIERKNEIALCKKMWKI